MLTFGGKAMTFPLNYLHCLQIKPFTLKAISLKQISCPTRPSSISHFSNTLKRHITL